MSGDEERRERIAATVAGLTQAPPRGGSLWAAYRQLEEDHELLVRAHNELVESHRQLYAALIQTRRDLLRVNHKVDWPRRAARFLRALDGPGGRVLPDLPFHTAAEIVSGEAGT